MYHIEFKGIFLMKKSNRESDSVWKTIPQPFKRQEQITSWAGETDFLR
jgi:hypothetical protein